MNFKRPLSTRRFDHFYKMAYDATREVIEFCIGGPTRPCVTIGFVNFCAVAGGTTKEFVEF